MILGTILKGTARCHHTTHVSLVAAKLPLDISFKNKQTMEWFHREQCGTCGGVYPKNGV